MRGTLKGKMTLQIKSLCCYPVVAECSYTPLIWAFIPTLRPPALTSSSHHCAPPPSQKSQPEPPSSSDTMAAILDYCVFTKLVCPLPPSHRLTFPPALPLVPRETGPRLLPWRWKRVFSWKGDWTLTVAVETWPHAALRPSSTVHAAEEWVE